MKHLCIALVVAVLFSVYYCHAQTSDSSAVLELKGHTGYVKSAVFSSDGKYVLTESADGTARIWDVETGKEIHKLKGYTFNVNSAVFSPDGKNIVTTSSDKTARIWDVETGKELHKLEGHSNRVNSAVFSPDGKQVVTMANYDKTPQIWDVATGKELHKLEGHTNWVESAVFSPDGKQVVTTASSDKNARIWDAATGKELHKLKGHTTDVVFAVFSPDGKQVVTASWDKTARIWDVETGKELHKLVGHTDYVRSAVFSPDGKSIVTAANYDKTARIWDVATSKELHKLVGHTDYVRSAVFSPDGKSIVTTSDDETIRIWDAATGKELHKLEGHTNDVRSAVFSPDGKKVVTANRDNTARIWNLQKWGQIVTAEKNEAEAEAKRQAEKEAAETKQQLEEMKQLFKDHSITKMVSLDSTKDFQKLAKYGTLEMADKYNHGDEFDKADWDKEIKQQLEELKKMVFILQSRYQARDVKINGDSASATLVVLSAELVPFVLLGPLKPLNYHSEKLEFKSSIATGTAYLLPINDLTPEFPYFMKEDNTIWGSISSNQRDEILRQNGVIYYPMSQSPNIWISISGKKEEIKELVKNADNGYKVEIYLKYLGSGDGIQKDYGYYRHDVLFGDRSNTTHLLEPDKLKKNIDSAMATKRTWTQILPDNKQPEFFVTKKVDEGSSVDVRRVKIVKSK